ncbi:MAG: DUF2630 family protein [Acidimicrobiales bacterium]
MEDLELVTEINRLAEEEHQLERAHSDSPLSGPDLEKLHAIEIHLDQCWDLLRQRRARRQAGQDPDVTGVRQASVVEGYQQ